VQHHRHVRRRRRFVRHVLDHREEPVPDLGVTRRQPAGDQLVHQLQNPRPLPGRLVGPLAESAELEPQVVQRLRPVLVAVADGLELAAQLGDPGDHVGPAGRVGPVVALQELGDVDLPIAGRGPDASKQLHLVVVHPHVADVGHGVQQNRLRLGGQRQHPGREPVGVRAVRLVPRVEE
jgi:hypothetical protein